MSPIDPSVKTNGVLTENQVKEHLALSYVYAVASRASCACQVTTVDMDSIDLKLQRRNDDDPRAVLRSPEVAIQVKAHPAAITGDVIPFPLPRKNHHDLVKRTVVPRLLVVVVLPAEPEQWLSISPDQLVLRRCGYWVNLLGLPPTENEARQTVHLPVAQTFDVAAVQRFMRQVAKEQRIS